MSYEFIFTTLCEKQINKATRKNPLLKKIINNKIDEITLHPHHYKPLRYNFAGERRVHIMRNYVLKFKIDEKNKIITFIFFGHHDKAY
ncbi:hypothetical protein CMI39_03480 [Candidatus Pacearchaeota archaeon]|jgi:addiction module RelE/StbE family toxin|nr:hypothetical protein [Candidatus Pacearchaeota archaeon]|tara:strand:+ start:20032 stop:20295 length:264 start_codon:yes stop_codon:yes gene_type:complete